jgi:hypothetical protein
VSVFAPLAEHGAKAVRDRVAALLAADLPGRIDIMCELWAIERATIAGPDMVTSGEAVDNALDHQGRTWIEVVTPRLMPRTQTVDMDPRGNFVCRFRYQARIYVWGVADTWGEALDQRDRIMVAGRDALLDFPTLAIPPAYGDTGYLVYRDTLSEEFGPPYRLPKSPRVWAGGALVYEVAEEYAIGDPTTRPQPGAYTEWDLAVTLLPYTHPATQGV